MTSKDYKILAEVCKAAREHALGAGKEHSPADLAIRVCSAMASALAVENPHFDRNTFVAACLPGVPDLSNRFGVVAVSAE